MTLGAGLWIYFHPALHAPARAAVPWLIGLLLFVKALLAISILRGLTRSRLIRRPAAALLLGGWSAVVLGLCLLACLLVPGQAIAWTTLVPSIALLVPFSRLAAAPLALAWNRHR